MQAGVYYWVEGVALLMQQCQSWIKQKINVHTIKRHRNHFIIFFKFFSTSISLLNVWLPAGLMMTRVQGWISI